MDAKRGVAKFIFGSNIEIPRSSQRLFARFVAVHCHLDLGDVTIEISGTMMIAAQRSRNEKTNAPL